MLTLRRSVVWLIALAFVLLPAVVQAQSNVATGQIQGNVADPQGAALPGATVTATNEATGFSRVAATEASGLYRLNYLPSGTYDLRVDMDGFRTEIKKGIQVTLGSVAKIDFSLQITEVKEEIVVTAQAPIVETTNPSVTSSVSSQAIANLPLNGRDFLDFVALTPASVPDSVGRVHIGGMRGIQNSFNIDGANDQSSFFGEERGGTRPPFTFSQGAIKEFQVLQSDYSVQYSASGGIINAITKSGTNEVHGEVFAYYRDQSFVADYADGRSSDDFKQKQFGAYLGGPIIKDKLHYFVSYDGQRYKTPTRRFFYNFPNDRISDWEALTGLSYADEVGTVYQTNDEDVLLLKADWQINQNHLLTVRDNYSKNKGQNLTSSYVDSGRSNNGLEENKFNSLVATLNSVLGDNAFNELIVQYSKEERPRTANNTSIPEVNIARGSTYDASFGQNNFLPNYLTEKRTQLIDNFTYFLGDHTLKAGVNLDLLNYDDGFFRYQGGSYFYDTWDDFFAGSPNNYTQSFSDYNGAVKFDANTYALYAEDDWQVTPNLTVTYGLRYDYQKMPTPQETNPLFPLTGQIPTDSNNWAPRAGFAWDINGDGTQVLRGGIGMFYDTTPTLLTANALLANGIRVVRVTTTCRYGGCPAFPDTYASQGDLPGATPDLFVFSPDFQNPETLRMSLGYEREIAPDLSVGVDLIYSRTHHLERKQDLNLAPNGGTTVTGRPTYDPWYYHDNYSDFGHVIMFKSDARAKYRAIILKARKRFSDGWTFNASYTYARARDNDSNERSVSSSGDYPEDQYNLNADWGPSNYDIKHRFVASGTVTLPYDFVLSAIVTIRSGFPFTATGYPDLNNDAFYNDRATVQLPDGSWYHYPRNSFRQRWYHNMDLRVTKIFRIFGDYELEVIAECFNVFNNDNWYTSQTQLVNRYGDINPNFGLVKDPSTGDYIGSPGQPRQYQVGLKFRF
jgi:outer membrane receptor protein involved in Fe transport